MTKDSVMNDAINNEYAARFAYDELDALFENRDSELLVAVAHDLSERVKTTEQLENAISQLRTLAIETLFINLREANASDELLEYCFDRF